METEEDTFEGFWALRVDPGLTFCQIAPASYRVTMVRGRRERKIRWKEA